MADVGGRLVAEPDRCDDDFRAGRAVWQKAADDLFGLVEDWQFLAGDKIAVDRRRRECLPGENAPIPADLAVFKERHHLLADKQTHRLLAGHAVDCDFIEQRRITERVDGQAEHLAVKRLLTAKMIIDRRQIDRCAAGDLAHRGAVETAFGEHIGGMIEERLSGNFGDLHAYNFLTREFSVSPMEATLSTTHVSEAVMMVPRLVTRRIPYWSGGSGSAFTGADATAGSTVGIGGGAGAGGGIFGALAATCTLLELGRSCLGKLGGRGGRGITAAVVGSLTATRVAWLVAATGAFRPVTWESATRCMKSASTSPVASPASFPTEGDCRPSSRAKGSMGFVTLDKMAMV